MPDLFKEDQTVIDETNYDDVGDVGETDYFGQLVGDGKKFKDTNALAKGKMQSDVFVQKLIEEKRQLEAELRSRQSVEDIFKKMRTEQPAGNQPEESHDTDTTAPIKPEDINRLVEDAVSKKTQEQIEARNLSDVMKNLEQSFGPQYRSILREKIKDLGVGEEFATDLAKTNPRAFLKLVGEAPSKGPDLFTPPASQVRTAPQATNTGKKNYAYFEKMRKTDPDLYRKSQSEMVQLAIQMGDDFYS